MDSEIFLWRAVIDLAFADALKGNDYNKARALSWFFNNRPESFRLVCDLAGVDPDTVRRKLFKILESKKTSSV